MVLIILIILIIILIIILYYLEIYRYTYINKLNIKDLYELDKNYYKTTKVKGRTVVSLTTVPSRINKIYPTLCSILSQSRRVDQIRINIPYKSLKGEKYKIPRYLRGLVNVIVVRVKEDLGPSTKLLPTSLDEKPDTKIIVIDDDIIYGSKFVETLVTNFEKRNSVKRGNKEAVCIYGANINVNAFSRQYTYFTGSGHVDVLFGCGGYILTPSMLPKQVYDYSVAPKNVIYVDDNWISGWLRWNGVKIYVVGLKYGCCFFPNIKSLSSISLSGGVNKNKKHEKITNKWFLNLNKYDNN